MLVAFGIAFEAAATITLFEFDEGISAKQQWDILEATDRATDAGFDAARANNAATAATERLAQVLSHRHLSPAQKERLAAVVKRFPSMNFLTITQADDPEAWDFVMEIAADLRRNGWNWIPCDGPLRKIAPLDGRPLSCVSMLDHIQIDGSKDKAEIVFSLAKALKDPAIIGMADVRPEISAAFPTIAIMVGTKR
jgi:hypothetical protein